RRNFHTLPLTTGGSAQTNTITASTTSDQRPAVRSAIAAASPPIMPTAVTTTTNTRVRQRASVVAPLVKPSLELARPVKSHSWFRVAEVTSLRLIHASLASG